MTPSLNPVATLWTHDMSVGSEMLDAQNRHIFNQLAVAERMVASDHAEIPTAWLLALFGQVDALLAVEEHELAAIDYPEMAFHHALHERGRSMLQNARIQLSRSNTAELVTAVARESCAALSLWLMRHVLEADKLFLPYIDARYCNAHIT